MIRVVIVLLLVLLATFVVWRLTRETPSQRSARLVREKAAEVELAERQQAHWERLAQNDRLGGAV